MWFERIVTESRKKYKADPKLPKVNVSSVQTKITKEKKAHITAVLKFMRIMPEVDKTFYRNPFANR